MDNSWENIAYNDLAPHVLQLTDSEAEYLYDLVSEERRQLKKRISQAQYLQREVPVKEYEWLNALYKKLAEHHRGMRNLED